MAISNGSFPTTMANQTRGYHQKFPDHWDLLTRINYLQRKIILCSIAYYEFDESPVSDYDYDQLSKDLAAMMKECENVGDSKYYYAFYDFDGSTGYHLYTRLTEIDREYLTVIAEGALADIRK